LSGNNISIFGGFEYFVPRVQGLRLKFEYDTTNYKYAGAEGERIVKQESPYNLSFVYAASRNFKFHLGAIRGNTIQVGFTYSGLYGKKDPLKIKNDPIKNVPNSAVFRQVTSDDKNALYLTALKYLAENQIYIQSAEVQKSILHVAFAQPNHQSYIRAAGRAATILDQVSPEYVDTFKLSSLNASALMHTIEIPRKEFHRGKENNDYESVAYVSEVYKAGNYEDLEFQPKARFPVHKYSFAPALRNHIGGPDGFYFGDISIAFHSEILLKGNVSILATGSAGVYNNFDDLKLASDSLIPHVRTDIVQYLKQSRKGRITRLQANYFITPRPDLFMKFTGGLIEQMFAGVGSEALWRPFDKNYAVGVELWRVQQRGYEMLFSLRDYKTTIGHVNLYYREPRSKITAKLTGGRFLAGDSGIHIDLSRRFKSGFTLGVFAAKTDISKTEFGEGSFDKGWYFHLPIEVFFSRYTKGNTGFGLRPLTRDGAAILSHGHHLYGVTDQSSSMNILRDWDDIYD